MRLSSFFVLRGLYLWMNFDIVDFLNITTHEQINKKKLIDISKTMKSI